MTHAPAPLDGTLVVDLSRHLPGPLLVRLLRDLGARVVKVEEPRRGDPVRESPPFVEGESALAGILLAGLESLALDLKRDGAREVLHAWLGRADVLVESFRPGTMERLGLDPEDLRERYPRLVICSVSGWGQGGPWAHRAGHDLTYEAVAGLVGATGSMPPAPVADVVGAWSGLSAVLAALLARERTGSGCWLDVSLLDAAVHSNLATWASAAGEAGERGVGLTGSLPCYRLYQTSDGEMLAVACLEPKFWKALCRLAGRPELEKLQYDTSEGAHRRVARALAARTRDQWTSLLAGEDLPVEPVATPSEARTHPQVAERGVLASDERGRPRLRFPVRFDERSPGAPSASLPSLGERTDALLSEAGSPLAEASRRHRRKEGVGRRKSFRAWLKRKVLQRWGS